MYMGSIVRLMRHNKPIWRHDSSYSSFDTGKGIFRIGKDLYNDESYQYYVLLINLLDRAILTDNLHSISIEQQELWNHYTREAHPLTINIMDIDEEEFQALDEELIPFLFLYDFNLLTDHIRVLDDFLGSYLGEEHGYYSKRYARYGKRRFFKCYRSSKKQLYRKCKHFSEKAEIIAGA